MAFTYLEAHGDPYHIGLAIGEHTRTLVHDVWQRYIEWYCSTTGNPAASMASHALGYVTQAARYHFPVLSELEGIAHGSSMTLPEIFAITCIEELDWPDGDHCTTMAVRTKQGILLGHNEDWNWRYKDSFYVVKARPLNSPHFVSAAYAGTPPGSVAGVNESGIAFAADSLSTERGSGVPKNVLMRRVLGCKGIYSVFAQCALYDRVLGNTLVVADSERAVAIEMSATECDTLDMKGNRLAHTNHALTGMKVQTVPIETGVRKISVSRLRRAKALLRTVSDEQGLRKALADHDGPICRHGERQTIASIVANPCQRTFSVCAGNPCEGTYETYRL